VVLRCGSLATSSITTRRWSRGGRAMHHIIDPRTGEPAMTGWRTVSVAAADCTDANIAATAALLRGPSAVSWLSERRLPARLVAHDAAVTVVGSWPAPPPLPQAHAA
jgi:thiamine biosynthesis lipoprotein